MFCRFCGQRIPETSAFCPFCGKSSALPVPPEERPTATAPDAAEPQEDAAPIHIAEIVPKTAEAVSAAPMQQQEKAAATKPSPTPFLQRVKNLPQWLWFAAGGALLLLLLYVFLSPLLNEPAVDPADAAVSATPTATVLPAPSSTSDPAYDADAFPPVNDPDFSWPLPGDGERLFIGEGQYDEIGRFYVAFVLAKDDHTIHDLLIRAEDISMEIDSGNTHISFSGSTVLEQYAAEYDISPGFLEVGSNLFEVLYVEGEEAYGELDYTYVYRNAGLNTETSAQIPVNLGLTQIRFLCYADNREQDPADAAAPTQEEEEATPDTMMYHVYTQAARTSSMVDYDEKEDAVVLPYTQTTERVEEAVAAINEALDGAPLRLMLTHKPEIGDNYPTGEYPYEALYALKCSELSLIDEHFASHGGDEKGAALPNLVELTTAAFSSWSSFPKLPTVRAATFVVSSDLHGGMFARVAQMPAPESFTLRIEKGAWIDSAKEAYALADLPALRTFAIEGTVDEKSRLTAALLCDAASMAPCIQSICGKAGYSAEEAVPDAEMEAYRKMRVKAYTEYICKAVSKEWYADGGKEPDGKTIVYVAGGGAEFYSSFADEVKGDYYGVDPDVLTDDPKECGRVIVVYADYEKVGFYTNGLSADKTHTTVAVVNTAEHKVYARKVVATKDPPQKINAYQSGNGEYLPEKAKSYVLNKLK